MIVNRGFFNIRLSMANDEFDKSQSVQLYSGIIAKVMILFKKAYVQQLIHSNGKVCTYAINKRSLAHYVWRNNRCVGINNYEEEMKSLYRISHNRFSANYKVHQSYIRDTAYSLSSRVIPNKVFKFQEFAEYTKKLAPLRGYFYKIKKNDQTVGYLLGSMHAGNELFFNLNDPIRKAIRKSSVIAGEEKIDAIGKKMIQLEKDLEVKSNKLMHINSKIMSCAAIDFKYGLEKMIVKFIEELKLSKKLVGLETDEEKKYSINLGIREANLNKINVKKEATKLVSIFRLFLSGKKLSHSIEEDSDLIKKDEVDRNQKMVERSIPALESDRTLIVVGAAHLYEDSGMIKLFESEGYRFYRK